MVADNYNMPRGRGEPVNPRHMNSGKGDWRRPCDKERYDENFERIFGKKDKKDGERK